MSPILVNIYNLWLVRGQSWEGKLAGNRIPLCMCSQKEYCKLCMSLAFISFCGLLYVGTVK